MNNLQALLFCAQVITCQKTYNILRDSCNCGKYFKRDVMAIGRDCVEGRSGKVIKQAK
jgi:hypothetical protein